MHKLNFFEYKDLSNHKIQLKDSDIHLWFFSTSNFNKDIPKFFENLNVEEKETHHKYKKLIDRQNYIIRHGVTKEILQKYLNKKNIQFSYNKNLKPLMEGINFNIAHNENYFIVGFSLNKQIGVDIQEIRTFPFLNQMIEDYLSDEEKNFLSNDRFEEDFFYVWCRKEAILKCLGIGLHDKMKNINTINCLEKNKWALIKTDFTKKDIWLFSLKKQNLNLSIAVN